VIKHPAFRLRSIADADAPLLAGLLADLEEYGRLTPFAELITDFEVVGSYARGTAELHSDLDINVATGTEERRLLAIRRIRANPDQFRQAIRFSRRLLDKYGTFIELALQHPTVKGLQKSCFSLREMRMYGTERRRVDINPETGAVTVRPSPTLQRAPRFSVAVTDTDGNIREYNPRTDTPARYDRWLDELPLWRRRYGSNLIEYGGTPETSWMN
jgi:hypothetical protein